MIDAMLDLFEKEWFHGIVGTIIAEKRLALRDAGYFLVRMNLEDYNNPFVISWSSVRPKGVYIKRNIESFLVQRLSYEFDTDQRFYMQYIDIGGNSYDVFARTIPELVDILLEAKIVSTPCSKSDDDMPVGPYGQFTQSEPVFSSTVDDIAPVKK